MKPFHYPIRTAGKNAGRGHEASRRGVLTLGLVICLIVIFTLAALLWNYQYMAMVNQDVHDTADLTMDAMTLPTYANTMADLAKAQLNYAVVTYNTEDLWAGTGNEGPFELLGTGTDLNITNPVDYARAIEGSLQTIAGLVTENSRLKATRIYTVPDTAAPASENLRTIQIAINGGQALAKTTRPANAADSWPTTVTGGAAAPTYTNFNALLNSRLTFYRMRTLGFLDGILDSPKTDGMGGTGGQTLEDSVEKTRDAFDYYVACNPYVNQIVPDNNNGMLNHVHVSPVALPVSFFTNNTFLSQFYSENAVTPEVTLEWEIVIYNDLAPPNQDDEGTLTWTYPGYLPAVSFVIRDNRAYAPLTLDDTLAPLTPSIEGAYETFSTLPDGALVCFPVVDDTVGGIGTVVDFVVFRITGKTDPVVVVEDVQGDDPDDINTPPAQIKIGTRYTTTLTLAPTCVVLDAINCDQASRKLYLDTAVLSTTIPDVFNALRCNTSMVKVMISDKPIINSP